MNFKISKSKFYESLQVVAKAISPNSPVPTLSGILMEAVDNKLILTGSDSDLSIRKVLSNETVEGLNLTILEEGSLVIDSRYLLEIVRKIDNSEINVEIIDGTFTRFSAGKIEFKINGIRPEEYPAQNFETPENTFDLKSEDFSMMIEETYFAANSKDTRVILTGVNLKSDGEKIVCTATDSYRLAKKILDVKCNPFNVTILAKNLNTARSIFIDPEEVIHISLNDKKVVFASENTIMMTKILDGVFPDTDRLIPTEFDYVLKINRRALLSAIDRSSFIRSDNMTIVRLEIKSAEEISISNKSQEIGESHEELVAESYTGEPLDISFTGNYVVDACKVLTTENIVVSFTGDMKPFVIRNDREEDSILQLVLPVKTYN